MIYLKTKMPKRWTNEDIQSAIYSIEDGDSVNKAAKIHGIPESTLRWRLQNTLKSSRKPHLSVEDENYIAKYAEYMSNIGHPCTVDWLRQLASRIAQKRFVFQCSYFLKL